KQETAPYIMFADADDFWEKDKIRKTYDLMKKTESSFGSNIPILVHTDLSVVGSDLEPISPSLWTYEKISPERTKLNQLLAQNNVTGCTVMINSALKDLIPSVPASFVMHDWWFALCASAFGKIAFLREPTMRYRQHGDNSVGAYDAGSLSASAKKLANKEKVRRIYDSMFAQAECFAEYYKDHLSDEQFKTCKAYGSLLKKPLLAKWATVIRYGFWKNTLIRNLGQFLAI
ncbi:MAG: glycosyltransferase family 2 protein, partial [Oscillospiraceae bacterium]|nr:glycosyltransferase family 2 protein [Oscillospiraceae bacterium]